MDESENQEDSEVLSQSEVERLLSQVEGESSSESTSVDAVPGEPVPADGLVEAQPYDFRQPTFLSQNELRKLRLFHEGFLRSLSSRFSLFLRMEFNVQLAKLHTLSYSKFVEELPDPTSLTLFKTEPLRGVCLLDIPPRLSLTLVDRLLGGPAHSVNFDREMTDIEHALLNQTVNVILTEWCSHWSKVQDLRPKILGHETNARFLQSSPHDTVMLVIGVETRVGDCTELMQFAFPCYTLEPVVGALNTIVHHSEDSPVAEKTRSERQWNPVLGDVMVPITAEWQDLRLSARDLYRLKPGDVLPLSIKDSHNVKVRLAKVNRFTAGLGTAGSNLAVELNKTLKD